MSSASKGVQTREMHVLCASVVIKGCVRNTDIEILPQTNCTKLSAFLNDTHMYSFCHTFSEVLHIRVYKLARELGMRPSIF